MYYPILVVAQTFIIFFLCYRNIKLTQKNNSLLRQFEDLKSSYDQLKDKISKRGNEVSLDEFLSDLNQYGYSYTRIDPKNMFYRNPRGE
ncbi:hypothetical protein CMI37_20805 [Candidatus Pacearchaeota archaeon]|nr:hypothetical protein [Candidatus Pacearchaeota archaeon]|tara:strand:- start:7038 stop:7304 length:267 start_codon:yes stop_codon:yes gene_type:complete